MEKMAKVEEEANTSTAESWETTYIQTVSNMETDDASRGKSSS